MGRKIMKSNRHKKLKAIDPFYVGDRKLFLDKGLVYANQKPFDNDADEQKLPGKMREYLELNEKLNQKRKEVIKETGRKKDKERKMTLNAVLNLKPDEKGAEVTVRQATHFKKLDNETDAAFLNRIDQEVSVALNKAQYETQYECTLETKDDKVVVKKDKKMSERKKRQLGKLKDKLKYEKDNKIEDEKDRQMFKDHIKFGEVVHQPPVLRPPKISRKYESSKAAIDSLNKKPGRKDLLLKQKLVPDESSSAIKINFTDKSKLQNMNQQLVKSNKLTEADRNAVIESYRQLKKSGKIK